LKRRDAKTVEKTHRQQLRALRASAFLPLGCPAVFSRVPHGVLPIFRSGCYEGFL
jgi:hypothetical protein